MGFLRKLVNGKHISKENLEKAHTNALALAHAYMSSPDEAWAPAQIQKSRQDFAHLINGYPGDMSSQAQRLVNACCEYSIEREHATFLANEGIKQFLQSALGERDFEKRSGIVFSLIRMHEKRENPVTLYNQFTLDALELYRSEFERTVNQLAEKSHLHPQDGVQR